MTVQLHAAAVLARLRTSGSPVMTVHDGKVPDTTPAVVPPYVLVRFSAAHQGASVRPDASNLIFQSLPLAVTARVYCVATSAQGARALTNRVSTALLDWAPSVVGRNCSPMRHLDQFEIAPDEQTGVDYFQLGDDYRFTSYPA